MIAALFVATGGAYYGIDGIDPWDETRDARRYPGTYPVIAHPPCARWGKFWFGSPRWGPRYKLGDDGGCFKAALRAVETWGGLIEHPESSQAWPAFGIERPRQGAGWIETRKGWTCSVDQGHYGHTARKPTWLYVVGRRKPPQLRWEPSIAKDPRAYRRDTIYRRGGRIHYSTRGAVHFMSATERAATPAAFRDLLIRIVRETR